MSNWIEAIASAEFGLSTLDKDLKDGPLSVISLNIKAVMCPPKGSDDAIYSKMYGVKRNLLQYAK